MPRYFFKLRESAALIDDPDGCEFLTLAAARAAAIAVARELVAVDLWANRPARLKRIEICDAAGQLLGTVSVQDALTDTEEAACAPATPFRNRLNGRGHVARRPRGNRDSFRPGRDGSDAPVR
jgi:hypothetical protein